MDDYIYKQQSFNRQRNRQSYYRINLDEYSPKIPDIFLQWKARKLCFPQNVSDERMDRWKFVFIVASLLNEKFSF